ncbi:MAG: methyltransferase domain-containing protein [Phycisphaerales bacterium]|nr:methyltransferase domain-containing protein [Phycisphaerales bacterium]
MADSVGTVSPPAAASALVLDAARVQFDKWALSYDRSLLNELVFFPTIRACQEEILRWHAARGGGDFSVLDVGCGTGRFVNLLAAFPAAKRLVGLDYSPVMVAQLREKIAASPHGAKVEAIEGDSEHLPFPPHPSTC